MASSFAQTKFGGTRNERVFSDLLRGFLDQVLLYGRFRVVWNAYSKKYPRIAKLWAKSFCDFENRLFLSFSSLVFTQLARFRLHLRANLIWRPQTLVAGRTLQENAWFVVKLRRRGAQNVRDTGLTGCTFAQRSTRNL